ncbi:MAG TPA: YceI family protein, partial [Planctomycetota bacterium]|nr:YceI family protein [Planctomycetota bacterium]
PEPPPSAPPLPPPAVAPLLPPETPPPVIPPRAPEKPLGEFFGFPVETLDRAAKAAAPAPRVLPSVVPVPPAAPPVLPAVVHLETLPGKCVAGFDGTSTLHDFRGWTKSVSGWIEYEPGRIDPTAKAAFVVDARTLDTGDKDRDRAMHEEHLESARYPEMRFTLSEFHSAPGGSCTIQGTLEIHGHRRPVEMAGTYLVRPDGLLYVKGQVLAKMSDFGITPPSKVLVIRTADEIKVWFEAWAAPREGKK